MYTNNTRILLQITPGQQKNKKSLFSSLFLYFSHGTNDSIAMWQLETTKGLCHTHHPKIAYEYPFYINFYSYQLINK